MDFLDPRAKKLRSIRLMAGYILVAILIFTSSTILVFQAYGFDVDRKTGQVIQNGLVYIDSAPDGASISINGEPQKDRTNARMTLPEGKYDLLIQKEGYRDWRRTFELHGGSVQRYTYPLLVLKELSENELANYGALRPILTTQSPDRRYVLVSKGALLSEYFEYDLNNFPGNSEKPNERPVVFPASLFTPAEGPHSLEVVEWSTDNKNVLIKHTYTGGFEFIVLNREEPAASININQLLGVSPTAVSLRDKQFDEWYLYQQNGGILQTADSKKTVTNVLKNVTAYKTHDSSVIFYAQDTGDGVQTVFLRQNNETKILRKIANGKIKLDIARYDGSWYAVIGSDGDAKTYVYKDPQRVLTKLNDIRPAPVAIIHNPAALSEVEFSTNTRFVMSRSGQHVGVYDAEKAEEYEYNVPQAFDADTPVRWMDGHRMIARSAGTAFIYDFDGSNNQTLVGALSGSTTFFDRDYTVLYTINNSKAALDTAGLIRSDLRLK